MANKIQHLQTLLIDTLQQLAHLQYHKSLKAVLQKLSTDLKLGLKIIRKNNFYRIFFLRKLNFSVKFNGHNNNNWNLVCLEIVKQCLTGRQDVMDCVKFEMENMENNNLYATKPLSEVGSPVDH